MRVTSRQFIENLESSGLFSPDQLESLRANLRRDEAHQDAKSLARRLVHQSKLTKFQAQAIRKTYGDTPWFATNRDAFEGAEALVAVQLAERQAEILYGQAVQFLESKDLFDVQDCVDRISKDFPGSRVVKDGDRNPSFTDLEEAVAKLGKRILVRKDGTGDFKSLQEAIDEAIPDSLIEIGDEGTYNESLTILREKSGLTIRGAKGKWPLITSRGPNRNFPILVRVEAPQTTIERVALVHSSPTGDRMRCLSIEDGSVRLRLALVFMSMGNEGIYTSGSRGTCEVENSLICTNITSTARLEASNSLFCGKEIRVSGRGCDLRCVSARSNIVLTCPANVLLDSIVRSVSANDPGQRIEYCDVYSEQPFLEHAVAGEECFGKDPMFRDFARFDFRLMNHSPCQGKASDGGDVGCRVTEEMQKMCEAVAKLNESAKR